MDKPSMDPKIVEKIKLVVARIPQREIDDEADWMIDTWADTDTAFSMVEEAAKNAGIDPNIEEPNTGDYYTMIMDGIIQRIAKSIIDPT